MDEPDETLRDLARANGVATEYEDWHGHPVTVTASTLRAVLAALGVDAADGRAARASLADQADRGWRRVLPGTVVCRHGNSGRVLVHRAQPSGTEVEVDVEDGGVRGLRQVPHSVPPRMIDGAEVTEVAFALPDDLPLGWHRLRVVGEDSPTAIGTLIVTPNRLELPTELADGRLWGLMTQVYATRSAGSWGIGDLSDLGALAGWGANNGAGFVLVNPLHAAEPVSPIEASPYRPATRRFVSPLYLRPDAIPEVSGLGSAGRRELDRLGRRARALNAADTIDRDAVWALKQPALTLIFHVERTAERQSAFDRFRRDEGQGLTDFATWCVLSQEYGLPWRDSLQPVGDASGPHAASRWPAGLRDPRSPEVARFAEAHRDEVAFHCWLQWQLADQLADAQRAARPSGTGLGIIHDLAVGVHPDGGDTWALGDALARTVSVGAPPDQFNQLGQNWQQPPWRPDALTDQGYLPYRDMLRAVLRDAGGVRVDHVMGLFRLWWVPQGSPPTQGTYVSYDPEAMIGVLALEAHRANAIVIGEDLGSVEPRVRDYLHERGMFGTSILWFEQADGRPLPPEDYRELCLAAVTTHDLPPTAGYLALEHVDVRERLGLLARPVGDERAEELRVVDEFRTVLCSRGLLEPGADDEAFVRALHAYLVASPARLIGVAVPDLVGDRRAVNQPGTDTEYPNWRVPVAGPDRRPLSLEEITHSPRAASLIEVVSRVGAAASGSASGGGAPSPAASARVEPP